MSTQTASLESTLAPRPSFKGRGPSSRLLIDSLRTGSNFEESLPELERTIAAGIDATVDIVHDDDLQLTLFILYGLHYGDFPGLIESYEWHPQLVGFRLTLERVFEAHLRANVALPELPEPEKEAVAAALFALTHPASGPSLSRYIAKKANDDQLREIIIQKSIYTLKEADPHSWAIPRLQGRAKAALIEIQMDEYGQGRPEHVHSAVFARTMDSLGLDSRYGAYVNVVPAITLTSFNMMSMFGLNRRLRGAIVGHLAAFEMTSSIPNRLYGDGFRRLGYGVATTNYFDIHVEADAIHEQIAGRDLAGNLAQDEPGLLEDIMFGAAACLTVDGWLGQHVLEAWQDGKSSLRLDSAEA